VLARIESLTSALPAEGPPTRGIIEKLLPEGDAVGAALSGRATDLERQAAQLEALSAAIHERRTLDRLTQLVACDEAEIDLFLASLVIAKLDNPDLDIDASRRELDRLADDVAKRLPKDADDDAKLAMLTNVLFNELGFHGSRGDYYNRSNSYVNEVLDDREGIPITLAIVSMEVARRLGLKLEGVGFPGHFLLSYTPAAHAADATNAIKWIDVFDRATERTRDDLARQLREDSGEELTDEHLAVVGPRKILVRMIGNLLGVAGREGRQADTLRYLDAILVIDPDSSRDRVTRMVTAARLDRRDTALEDAHWLLAHEPPGIDLDQISRLVDRLEGDR
jgi:serine protease Do